MTIDNLVVNIEDSQVKIFFNNSIHNNLFIDYEYSINKRDTWNIPIIKKNNDNNYFFIITGLINNKKYDIIIRSKNRKEDIAVIEVIPLCNLSSPIIHNIIIGKSYAIISFISSNINDSNTFYEYSIDNGIEWNKIKIENDKNGSYDYKIENLINSKSYNVIFRSNNFKQTSKPTFPVSITPIGPPEPPTELLATINNSLINISFIQGNNNGSQIRGYYYSIDNCITWNILKTKYSKYGTVFGSIAELQINNTYIINLCCYNSKGKSIPSKPITVLFGINKKIEKKMISIKKYESNLKKNILENPVLEEVTIQNSILEEVTIQNSILEEVTIQNSILEEVTTQNSILEEVTIQNSILEEVTIQNSILEEVTIQNSILEEVTIQNSILEEVTIQKSILEEEILENYILENYILENYILENYILENYILEEEILKKYILEEKILENYILEKKTLEKVNTQKTSISSLTYNDPIIISQPISLNVNLGEFASFTVIASDTTTLNYQWYFSGLKITGATSSTYFISSTIISNAGIYYVTITNSIGCITSNNVTLFLIGPMGPIGSIGLTGYKSKCNIVKEYLNNLNYIEFYDKLYIKLYNSLYDKLYDKSYNQLYNQLYNNFYTQISLYGNMNILGPCGEQGLIGPTCYNNLKCKKNYLYYPTYDLLYSQLYIQLYNKLYNQLYNKLYVQLYVQLYNELKNSNTKILINNYLIQGPKGSIGPIGHQGEICDCFSPSSKEIKYIFDNELFISLHNKLYNNIYNQIYNQLYDQLNNQLNNQLYNKLNNK